MSSFTLTMSLIMWLRVECGVDRAQKSSSTILSRFLAWGPNMVYCMCTTGDRGLERNRSLDNCVKLEAEWLFVMSGHIIGND